MINSRKSRFSDGLGGVILLLLLSSCTNDDDKKMIVCWGDSLTASHTNGTGYKGMVKGWIKGDDS